LDDIRKIKINCNIEQTNEQSKRRKTKGFVAEKLKIIPSYPSSQNTQVDGVTWFKEDSYKGTSYDWLSGVFATASKKQTRK